MRRALLLLMIVACDRGQKSPSPAQGSGLTAPQANLMGTVANGVTRTPRTGSAAAATPDAAVPAADAGAPQAAATGPTLSAKGGLSTLGPWREWSKLDDQEVVSILEKKLGLAGVKVSFEVMDVPGDVEREEGYYGAKRGDKDIIQFLRTMAPPDGYGPLAVIVWTADVPTADGIKVGDTFAALVAKHPDVKCKEDAIAQTVYADISCQSASEPQLSYFINPNKAKIKAGKAKPDTAEIVGIAHEF